MRTLSASDFVSFTNKQASGNYLTALTGDGTATGPDGGGSAAFTLANSGVSAGTYPKVTVDTKGRVTNGEALVASDIPDLDAAKVISGTLPVARGGTGAATVAANRIFAGPDGASGAPLFRTIAPADLPLMGGANGTTAGSVGAVPAPGASDNSKYLRR